MTDPSNPKNIDLEDPVTCSCLPIKYVVAAVQLAIIFISVKGMAVMEQKSPEMFALGLCLLFMILLFAGYIFEQKHLMYVHYKCALLVAKVGLGFAVCSVFVLLVSIFTGPVWLFAACLSIPFVTIYLIYYVSMCGDLVIMVYRKTSTESPTIQTF